MKRTETIEKLGDLRVGMVIRDIGHVWIVLAINERRGELRIDYLCSEGTIVTCGRGRKDLMVTWVEKVL